MNIFIPMRRGQLTLILSFPSWRNSTLESGLKITTNDTKDKVKEKTEVKTP
jgi:hypothetical protein